MTLDDFLNAAGGDDWQDRLALTMFSQPQDDAQWGHVVNLGKTLLQAKKIQSLRDMHNDLGSTLARLFPEPSQADQVSNDAMAQFADMGRSRVPQVIGQAMNRSAGNWWPFSF